MPIVSAVDDMEHDQRIVSEGAALADAFGDELHVIHVQDREDIEEHTASDATGTRSSSEVSQDIAADIASLSTDEYKPVGRIGSPASEIRQYVDEVDARYLVVGGRKRSPIGKALFGSTTQSLLLNVDKPVVTVRTQAKK